MEERKKRVKVIILLEIILAIMLLILTYDSFQSEGREIEKKKVAITFDDGPHPIYTRELLAELKKRNVQATFFVLGSKAEIYPDIIEEMIASGNLVGNHTYSHVQLTAVNKSSFREELVKTNDILKNITGEDVTFVRPPFGAWNKKLEKELNMFPVLWSVDPRDWTISDKDLIVQRVIKEVEENDIILLHDNYESSIQAAIEIIDILTEKGYYFVTVDEILLD